MLILVLVRGWWDILINGFLIYEGQRLPCGSGWALENTGRGIEALDGFVPCLILEKPSLCSQGKEENVGQGFYHGVTDIEVIPRILSISSVLQAHCYAAASERVIEGALDDNRHLTSVILIDGCVCAMTAVLAVVKYQCELWHLPSSAAKPCLNILEHLV